MFARHLDLEIKSFRCFNKKFVLHLKVCFFFTVFHLTLVQLQTSTVMYLFFVHNLIKLSQLSQLAFPGLQVLFNIFFVSSGTPISSVNEKTTLECNLLFFYTLIISYQQVILVGITNIFRFQYYQ